MDRIFKGGASATMPVEQASNALVNEAFVILGGPLEGTSDVLLVVRATTPDKVRSRLAEDPWASADLLRVARVAPWTLRLGALREWLARARRSRVTWGAMRDPQALDGLNARLGVPGLVEFASGEGGLPTIRVTAPAAEATIYLHGAHVTHHRPTGASPLLFLSARSRFAPGAAIRGGVPLVFPWFGARAGHPTAPDHGFARICEWTVESVERIGDGVAVALALGPSEATRSLWPSEFRLTYRVHVQAALELTLVVENRSKAPFTFEEALHTYLAVGDVRQASVVGLEGREYVDKADSMKRKALAAGPFRPSGETDRVFPATAAACTVEDPVLGRRLIVDKVGSATTVVWNPWSDKAARMADLGADQWSGMLCVEAANAMDDAVKLGPGERHAMGVVIRAVSI